MSFSKNLKYYRIQANLSQGELAKKIEQLTNKQTTYENVKSWENGTNIKLIDIYAIAETLGIPEQILFDNSQQALNKVYKILSSIHKQASSETIKKIPLINGYVGAGSSGKIGNEQIDTIHVDIQNIQKAYRSKEIQAIKVIGDSMSPYANEDDIVLFYPYRKGEFKRMDGKYIINTTEGQMVKNLKFLMNGAMRIISENPSYRTEGAYDEEINKDSQDNITIIGIVVGRILKG